MFERIKSLIRPRAHAEKRTVRYGAIAMQGGYEGASAGRRMVAFNPTHENVNSLLVGGSETLRARARHLARNNAWAGNAIDSYVGNVVSTGIKPQFQHPSSRVKKAMQEAWLYWTDEADAAGLTDFYGLEALACRAIMEAGECFVRILYRGPEANLSVPIQLQLLEAEMVPSTLNQDAPDGSGNPVRCGIEFDKNDPSKRLAYWVWKQHPGSGITSFTWDWTKMVRIPADQMLHLFRPLRPEQMRGQPWLAPVIAKLYDVDKYDDATLLGQQISAMFAGFIISPNSDENPVLPGGATSSGLSQAPEGVNFAGLEPGTVQELLPGEDVKFSSPPALGATYVEFMRMQLRQIAAGLGITPEQLTGDVTQVNYSSIRAGLLEFRRRAEQFQHAVLVFQMCRPIARIWVEQAVLAGAFPAPRYLTNKRAYQSIKWIAPGWPWVDPLKDITALGLEVLYGFTSRASVVSQKGEDVETVDQEQAQDNARADQLKVGPYDSDARKDIKLAASKGALHASVSDRNPTQDNQDPNTLDNPGVAELRRRTVMALSLAASLERDPAEKAQLDDLAVRLKAAA